MSKHHLAIIHFGDLAKYPPATNALAYFSEALPYKKIIVCSRTKYKLPLQKLRFFNTSNLAGGKLARLISYFYFYLKCFFTLCYYRPQKLLYYETLSYPPVHFYCLLQRFLGNDISIYAHYHEYATVEEYNTQMQLAKWSHQLELKQYNNFTWISHTNLIRLQLYAKDNPQISSNVLQVLPNYPPKAWEQMVEKSSFTSRPVDNAISVQNPLRLVYVGSLDIDTMYTKELVLWVQQQAGKVTLHLFSSNCNQATKAFLEANTTNWVSLKGSIAYDQLPLVLPNYEVGVIMYKCLIPNVVYCEPNKFFEYITCGLAVWYPKEMIGMKKNRQESVHPKVKEVNYQMLDDNLLERNIGFKNPAKQYIADDALQPLIKHLF